MKPRFLLYVCAVACYAATGSLTQAQTSFANPAAITVPNGTQVSPQKASVYPSTISVAGLSGTISKVSVTLSGISTPGADPNGINALLVSPSGAKLAFMAHPGDGTVEFTGATLVFDDTGSTVPGCNVSTCTFFASGSGTQTYKPTAWTPPVVPVFPAPAPSSPALPQPVGSATFASTFNGVNPNGTWSLFILSDATVGSPNAAISGGWSLTLTTAAATSSTATSVSSSVNPSYTTAPNNLAAFTATVTSKGSVVTQGTVTFGEGATTLSVPVALNPFGQAVFTTNFPTEGAHTITATYNGTASLGQSSGTVLQTVLTHTTNPLAGQYCNPGPITIPQNGLTGAPSGDPANPYPSLITVSGMSGTISKLTVTFTGIAHPHPNDIAMLLVAPSGAAYVLWSAVASGNPQSPPPSGVTITLDDNAANALPASGGSLSSGTFRPSVYNATVGPTFPSPAPASFNSAPPFGLLTLAQAFNGLNPNGTWSLYVVDDQGGNTGSTLNGWCLNFTTGNDKPSITSVSSALNPAFTGSPVAITATVKDANTLAAVTVGTVTFTEGITLLAGPTALDGSGQAGFTNSTFREGDHIIKASYNGSSGNYNVSFNTLDQRMDIQTVVNTNQFCNPGTVSITATGATAGAAFPYPSRIFVTNAGAGLTKLTVTLRNFSHEFPSQCQMLLVGPDGSPFEFLGHELGNTPVTSLNLTLDGSAANLVPGTSLGAGNYTFKPTSANGADSFPPPAPAGPYNPAAPGGTNTFGSVYTNKDANGTWSLYVNTLQFGGNGSIGDGWCLNLSTRPTVATNPLPQNACAGAIATFGAAANGLPVPSIQWQANGGSGFTNIPGATSTPLSFTASPAQNGYQYRAVFTNDSGATNSSPATLTVNPLPPAPAIALAPASLCPGVAGNQASGPAGASGYSWTISNGTITSATNLQTITYTAGGAGGVTLGLVVMNSFGCSAANSTNVPVSPVIDPPGIVALPSSPCPNSAGNQASTASGFSSYAWTISNGTITSATNLPTITYTAGATGTVTFHLVLVNASGCSVAFSGGAPIFLDTAPPSITCPSNITVTATGNCPAVVTFNATATDNCSLVTVVANPPSGSAFPVGTNVVKVTASDPSGNTNSCTFTVTVRPGIPPKLNIVHAGANVLLSWSSSYDCYNLQSTPKLLSPPSVTPWTPYTGPRGTNGGNFVVTNSAAVSNRFYRLAY